MSDNSSLKKLMKYFSIGINKDYKNVSIKDKIRPLETKPDGTFGPVDFPSFIERLYDTWINNCFISKDRYKSMNVLWEDMDLLYFNNVLTKRGIDLYTDETIQADLSPEYIEIEATPKVKDYLLEFFDRITLYSKIRPAVEDLIQYGNSGWILNESDENIEEIIQPDIYDLKDILQFSPKEIDEKIKNKDRFFIDYSSKERIQKLLNLILHKENYSSYYKKYIIGYQIGEYVLPPWKFLHIKNTTSKSPFDPYGIPMFIHSVAAYKQYDAAMTLQMMMRAAKLPIEKFEINAPNTVDPVSKLKMVVDFLRNFQNSGFSTVRKEERGVG